MVFEVAEGSLLSRSCCHGSTGVSDENFWRGLPTASLLRAPIPLLGGIRSSPFNSAKAQSNYRRLFGARPRASLHRPGITTQQTSRVVGDPRNSCTRVIQIGVVEVLNRRSSRGATAATCTWTSSHCRQYILVVSDKLITRTGMPGDLPLELGVACTRSCVLLGVEGRLEICSLLDSCIMERL